MSNKLTKVEIEDIFNASLSNANSLWGVALHNLQSKDAHVSLGLAEIALEEIGKSYICLYYYSLENCWDDFWREFKDHRVKSNRAFFYEWFNLSRVEVSTNIKPYSTPRKFIHHEKEASFYVDFDLNRRKVLLPAVNVSRDEIVNRISTIFGLLCVAIAVGDKFQEGSDHYKNAFSDYARLVIIERIYQKDILSTLEKIILGICERINSCTDEKAKSEMEEYAKGLYDIGCLFHSGTDIFKDMLPDFENHLHTSFENDTSIS